MNHRILSGARARAFAATVSAVCLLQSGLSWAQQTISTVAGNGTYGSSGDGGPATSASISYAYGIAVDAAGNRYIADTNNARLRKVTPGGVISTVAGNGVFADSGDGGLATAASFILVNRVAVDASGNLYLPDYSSARIRKVNPSGIISTVVGNGVPGYSGDGGPATSANINGPIAIAIDRAGNLFFTDYNNSRVRKVNSAGVISTVAGNGTRGYSGDGGPATSASLQDPLGLAVDSIGNFYIADTSNNRIRKVNASGIISTVVGTGAYSFSGDGGSATSATLAEPWDVKVDGLSNLYIADSQNHRIRKVTPAGIISTIAGNGSRSFSGDGGPATLAGLNYPTGIALGNGSLHIADVANIRVRKVLLFTTCAAEGFIGQQLTMCRQVCEISQPTSTLTSLITLYTTLFRTPPPCAR